MLKIKQSKFFIYLILGLVAFVYLFPGFVQFFLGVPATVYALGATFIVYLIVLVDIILRKRVIINNTLSIFLLFAFVIILSGIVNASSFLEILLYLNYALIPLSVIYLIELVRKRNLQINGYLNHFFRFIILIQLPIILLQKYGYDFFIPFSNANQTIAEVDFMFGTFALKADHALGFFLIVYLLNIVFKLRSGELKKIPYFFISYIAVTILIMESNLTKLVFLLIIACYLSLWILRKINIIGLVFVAVVLLFSYRVAMTSKVIESQVEHMVYTLNDRYVLKAVERGYAKRPHVVLYQLNHEKFKWIGNGPYDYYDIFNGKFKKTFHFSQIIWSYNDIGIIGLGIVLFGLLATVKGLNLTRESKRILIGVMLMYLFMTNVYGDISMMLSLLLLNNNTESEHV